MPTPILYRARHVFPVSAPPIGDGAVVVVDDRIKAVGSADELMARFPAARVVDLGTSALLPAAINAHTHLELTGLAGSITEGLPFAEWIVELVRVRRQATPADLARAAADGAAMARASGTAAIGEICTHGLSVAPILASGLRGIIYAEVLGINPAQAADLLLTGQSRIHAWRTEYGEEQVRFGLSLHTPYTVSAELFRLATRWCVEEEVPLCIHAAESPAETEWLLSHQGPITDLLYRPMGLPFDPAGPPRCSPIAYLDRLGVLASRPLLAHGVQVDATDLVTLAATNTPVAHCPRSNSRLLCGRLPYAAYRAAGVPLALGTDSLASSPSLSLWDELIFAGSTHAAAGEAPAPEDLLRLATVDGAAALGLASELGSIEVGKRAMMACAALTPLAAHERERADLTLAALCAGRLSVQALPVG